MRYRTISQSTAETPTNELKNKTLEKPHNRVQESAILEFCNCDSRTAVDATLMELRSGYREAKFKNRAPEAVPPRCAFAILKSMPKWRHGITFLGPGKTSSSPR